MDGKFVDLANRIYLSPKKEVLEDCSRFVEEAKLDISLLKNIDTSGVSVHCASHRIHLDYDDVLRMESIDCENQHLVKSLVEGYAISDIKKSS